MRKKVNLDCGKCRFESICPMAGNRQRLAFDDGGLGLCPKLPELKLLRCRNCLFCHRMEGVENGHRVYICQAMHTRMREDGKIPATTPRDCPVKEAKRKGL